MVGYGYWPAGLARTTWSSDTSCKGPVSLNTLKTTYVYNFNGCGYSSNNARVQRYMHMYVAGGQESGANSSLVAKLGNPLT